MAHFTGNSIDDLYLQDVIDLDLYCELKAVQNYKTSKSSHRRSIFSIENFNDYQFKKNFRFEKQEFAKLYNSMGIPETFQVGASLKFTGIEGLCVLLRRLATPSRYFDIVATFNRDETVLCRMFYKMLEFIDNKFNYLLSHTDFVWLNEGHMHLYENAIQGQGGCMPHVVGFIDGTARPICRPTLNQKAYYSGHKRQHCVKFQCVTLPNGILAHVDGGYVGSRHDSAILLLSGLRSRIQRYMNMEDGTWFRLYGDQGYANSKYIISPNRGNVGYLANQFNIRMGRTRQCVEWGFGIMLSQWALLDYKMKMKILLSDVQKFYRVAAILTNCLNCIRPNEISQFFNCSPPNIETYLNTQ